MQKCNFKRLGDIFVMFLATKMAKIEGEDLLRGSLPHGGTQHVQPLCQQVSEASS